MQQISRRTFIFDKNTQFIETTLKIIRCHTATLGLSANVVKIFSYYVKKILQNIIGNQSIGKGFCLDHFIVDSIDVKITK